MRKFLKTLTQNTAALALVIGIVIALNMLAARVHKRWDLTEEKEFTLSDSTKKILSHLDDRLTIKLYYSKNLPPQLQQIQENISDIIDEIKASSAKPILVEEADPDSNEAKEQETAEMGITPLQVNIIEKDKRELKKIYMGMALYYQDKKQVIPVVAQAENFEYEVALTILKLTEKELPKIGIVLPKDETQAQKYQLLTEVLKDLAEPMTISYTDTKLVDQHLKALILVGPRDVSKSFLKEVDALTASGVNVMLFAGRVEITDNLAPLAVTTGLDDWLAAKGVGLSEKLLLDPRQNAQAMFNAGSMQVFVPYPFWVKSINENFNMQNPVTAQIEEVLMPWTNVIEKKDGAPGAWTMTPLVSSSKLSFLQEDEMPNVSPKYMEDMTKTPEFTVYPLSAVLENPEGKNSGRIFLTANFYAIQDNFLQQAPINAIFLQNMTEYSSRGDDLISIRSRGKTSRPLVELSDDQRSLLKWGHMVGVPVAAVGLGLAMLFIHKRRRARLIRQLTSDASQVPSDKVEMTAQAA